MQILLKNKSSAETNFFESLVWCWGQCVSPSLTGLSFYVHQTSMMVHPGFGSVCFFVVKWQTSSVRPVHHMKGLLMSDWCHYVHCGRTVSMLVMVHFWSVQSWIASWKLNSDCRLSTSSRQRCDSMFWMGPPWRDRDKWGEEYLSIQAGRVWRSTDVFGRAVTSMAEKQSARVSKTAVALMATQVNSYRFQW